MNKNIKTGILAALLVVPVFLLIILYKFGNNQFSIPVYRAVDEGHGIVPTNPPVDSVLIDNEYVKTAPHFIPDFEFKNQENEIVNNQGLKGTIYVADFFFSRCQGICKTMSSQLVRVQEEFKENDKVKIVSFTVDPNYDTVSILKEYAKFYRAIPGKWNFLTGSKDSIYKLAGPSGFFLSAKEIKDIDNDFIHDNRFVLIDKEGRIRGFYDGTDKKEVDRLITEIGILLHEYGDE